MINELLSNQSKKEGKDQESIQSSTIPDPGHHMGKSQEVSRSQGCKEQTRQYRMEGQHEIQITKIIHKSTALERSVKNPEGLKSLTVPTPTLLIM